MTLPAYLAFNHPGTKSPAVRIADVSQSGLIIRLTNTDLNEDLAERQAGQKIRLPFNQRAFRTRSAEIADEYSAQARAGHNGATLRAVDLIPGEPGHPAQLLVEVGTYAELIAANEQWKRLSPSVWHQAIQNSETGIPLGYGRNVALVSSLVTLNKSGPALLDHWRAPGVTNEPNTLSQAIGEGFTPKDLQDGTLDLRWAVQRGAKEEFGVDAHELINVWPTAVLVEASGNVSIATAATTTISFENLLTRLPQARRGQVAEDGDAEALGFFSTSISDPAAAIDAYVHPQPTQMIIPDSDGGLVLAAFTEFPSQVQMSSRPPTTAAAIELFYGRDVAKQAHDTALSARAAEIQASFPN